MRSNRNDGPWLSVDGVEGDPFDYDNLQSGTMSGTKDWQRLEVVADNAIEKVSRKVKRSGTERMHAADPPPTTPKNLDFEQ
jgi:hypothetical protein